MNFTVQSRYYFVTRSRFLYFIIRMGVSWTENLYIATAVFRIKRMKSYAIDASSIGTYCFNLRCDQWPQHRVYRIDLAVVSKYDVLRCEFFSSLAKGRRRSVINVTKCLPNGGAGRNQRVFLWFAKPDRKQAAAPPVSGAKPPLPARHFASHNCERRIRARRRFHVYHDSIVMARWMKSAHADGHGSYFVQSEQTSKALKLRLIVPTWKIADFIFRLSAHANCFALVMRRSPRTHTARCCYQAYLVLLILSLFSFSLAFSISL